MTKKWTVIQNIIAAILQAWSLYFLYSLTDQILTRLNQGKQLGILKLGNTVSNFGSLFKLYHLNYFTGILAFYGGFALLYEKKKRVDGICCFVPVIYGLYVCIRS